MCGSNGGAGSVVPPLRVEVGAFAKQHKCADSFGNADVPEVGRLVIPSQRLRRTRAAFVGLGRQPEGGGNVGMEVPARILETSKIPSHANMLTC